MECIEVAPEEGSSQEHAREIEASKLVAKAVFPTTTEIFDHNDCNCQKSGKTIVINSWNKYCSTCAAQTKVFDQAMKDFKDVEFLFYEQDKNKDIAKTLGINYWTTIVVFKGQNEVGREMGLTDKDQIYSLINKGI